MSKEPNDVLSMLPRFERLHVSFRLLFLVTCICLSIGYVFNMLQVWQSHGNGNGILGISPDSIATAYYGKRDVSILESKLRGTMGGFATPEEKETIIRWIRDGSPQDRYNAEIAEIVQRNCLVCHGAETVKPLTSYEKIQKVTAIDTGMSLKTLVRVSHIHLNGLTFLFFISGLITCFVNAGPRQIKWIIIVAPMIAMLGDILSWGIARKFEWGIYIVLISGAIMSSAFGAQMLISISQILKSFSKKNN